MRKALLRCLGKDARLQSSYLPGRSGFVLTSSRSLEELRAALTPRWACRLYPLHRESGRLFLEPTNRWLSAALLNDQPHLWWTVEHQAGAQLFFNDQRSERLRRLAGLSRRPSFGWLRGFRQLRLLALRLEALHVTPRPDKQWRSLGVAFDDWWNSTPLYAHPQGALVFAVLDELRACLTVACSDLDGKGTLPR